MGFEQLAELKKQLAAARAEAAPARKSGAKAASKHAPNPATNPASKPAAKAGGNAGANPGGKPGARPGQGARPARRPAQPRRDASAAPAEAKPAVDARPVDPVVKSIGRLQKRFPVAFPKNPAPKLPLKVGIFEDLVVHAKELSLSEAELRDAIKTWCRGSRYWKCLVEGAARVDLTGAEAGKVTAQEAAGAQRLQAHRAGRGAQKAAAGAADAGATPAAGDAAAVPNEVAGEAAAEVAAEGASEVAAEVADNAAANSPAVSAESNAADSVAAAADKPQAGSADTSASNEAPSTPTPASPSAHPEA